jgi:hypothetical protein
MATFIVLYGWENWPLNRANNREIETAEIKSLIKVAGHTLRVEISFHTIRNELKIFSIGERIADSKQLSLTPCTIEP